MSVRWELLALTMPVRWEILPTLEGVSGISGRQERRHWIWNLPCTLAISSSDSEAVQRGKAQTLKSADLEPDLPAMY